MVVRIDICEREGTINKERKMNEQEKEVRFENAVNRLDKLFLTSFMTQEDYDFLYAELKKKFGFR